MTAPSLSGERQTLVALDLARASAALLVFLGHVKQSSLVAYAELPVEHQGLLAKSGYALSRLGHEAVLVFFVLSGFLVGGQALRRAATGRFDVIDYAIERGTRIFPPLLLAIGLTLAIDALVFKQEPEIRQALAHTLGLNGVVAATFAHNVPLWSLAYEIWFYLLAGAACVLATTRRGAAAAFVIAALATCVFTVLSARYLMFWCLGALAVFILDNRHKIVLGLGGLSLAAVGVVGHQLSLEAPGLTSQPLVTRHVAEAMIVIGVCLGMPTLCDRTVNAALRPLAGVAAYLSSMSYTLYLVHFPLNVALEAVAPQAKDLSWASIATFLARAAVIFIAANVLYFMAEKHTAALRGWVRRLLAGRLGTLAKRSADHLK